MVEDNVDLQLNIDNLKGTGETRAKSDPMGLFPIQHSRVVCLGFDICRAWHWILLNSRNPATLLSNQWEYTMIVEYFSR